MPGLRVASTAGAGWTVETVELERALVRWGIVLPRYGVGGHGPVEHRFPAGVGHVHTARVYGHVSGASLNQAFFS